MFPGSVPEAATIALIKLLVELGFTSMKEAGVKGLYQRFSKTSKNYNNVDLKCHVAMYRKAVSERPC